MIDGPKFSASAPSRLLVAVVVDHEVAERAVERDELRHLLVRRAWLAAPGDVVAVRVGRVDAARQLLERLAVDLRVGGAPERLDVAERGGHELVVGTRLLVVADVRPRRRCRWSRRSPAPPSSSGRWGRWGRSVRSSSGEGGSVSSVVSGEVGSVVRVSARLVATSMSTPQAVSDNPTAADMATITRRGDRRRTPGVYAGVRPPPHAGANRRHSVDESLDLGDLVALAVDDRRRHRPHLVVGRVGGGERRPSRSRPRGGGP